MFIRKLMTWGKLMVVAGGVMIAANAASACEPPCYYKKVVTYVCQQEPYQACVVKYDHCGQPYHAYVTQYRTVHVPVVKLVKVFY